MRWISEGMGGIALGGAAGGRLDKASVAVDMVVTMDPVTPPDVPGNVRYCYNLYQSNGAWDKVPMFRGVPLKLAEGAVAERTRVDNVDVKLAENGLYVAGTD